MQEKLQYSTSLQLKVIMSYCPDILPVLIRQWYLDRDKQAGNSPRATIIILS
jgi:hypothetical protein